MNKQGVELSITTLVVLIIMIITFIGATTLTFRFFIGAQQLEQEIDRSTQEQIDALLKSSNTLIALPISRAQLTRGQQKTFGIGIRNVGPSGLFSIRMEFESAFDAQEHPIPNTDKQFIESTWLGELSTIKNLHIASNQYTKIPLIIKAQGSISSTEQAPRGTYVFNVCIYKQESPQAPCQPGQNTAVFYDKKIHQILVEIT